MQLTKTSSPNSAIFIEKKWVENRLWGKSGFLWGEKNVSSPALSEPAKLPGKKCIIKKCIISSPVWTSKAAQTMRALQGTSESSCDHLRPRVHCWAAFVAAACANAEVAKHLQLILSVRTGESVRIPNWIYLIILIHDLFTTRPTYGPRTQADEWQWRSSLTRTLSQQHVPCSGLPRTWNPQPRMDIAFGHWLCISAQALDQAGPARAKPSAWMSSAQSTQLHTLTAGVSSCPNCNCPPHLAWGRHQCPLRGLVYSVRARSDQTVESVSTVFELFFCKLKQFWIACLCWICQSQAVSPLQLLRT